MVGTTLLGVSSDGEANRLFDQTAQHCAAVAPSSGVRVGVGGEEGASYLHTHTHIYICTYVYMSVCMYIYTYIYV